jgi:hypothetical protein
MEGVRLMTNRLKVVSILIAMTVCFWVPAVGAQNNRAPVVLATLEQPLAVLPAAVYRFDPVVEGQEVAHAFVVQNKGSAPLEIHRVKTD